MESCLTQLTQMVEVRPSHAHITNKVIDDCLKGGIESLAQTYKFLGILS